MKTIFLRYIPRARVCPSSCGWGCAGLRVDLQTIPLENDGFIHAGEERLILALSLGGSAEYSFPSIIHPATRCSIFADSHPHAQDKPHGPSKRESNQESSDALR